jgi:hypothetical protein
MFHFTWLGGRSVDSPLSQSDGQDIVSMRGELSTFCRQKLEFLLT